MKSFVEIFKLAKKYRSFSLYIFWGIFVCSSILEMFGISLFIPLIAIILDPSFLIKLSSPPYYIFVPNIILEIKQDNLLIIFALIIVLTYVVKNVIILLSVFLINKFVGSLKANLSNKLMENYLSQNYLYHASKKNSEVNANINQKIDSVAMGSVSSFLYITSELFIIFALISLIFISNQGSIFLILSAFLLIGILVSKIVSKKIKKFAIEREEQISKKFASFNNLVDNMREIIFLGKKNFVFLDFFNSHNKLAKIDAKQVTYQRFPALLFEMMGIFGLLVTIFYLKYLEYPPIEIITTCTFFAAISYKVIPSLNKIIFYYYQIKYTGPILKTLTEELNLQGKIVYHNEQIDFKKNITLRNVSFAYQENLPLLKNINLEIAKGSVLGIVGQSGSGKTTFLDIVSGLIEPSSGYLKIDDTTISGSYLSRKFQNIISYASQKITIVNDNLKKNICFGIEEKDINHDKYLKVIKMAELHNYEKIHSSTKVIGNFGKNISGGQLQRIGIARSLYFDKEIMIFDESTSSLDRETEEKIINNISNANLGKTIIIVSHRIENLKNCSKIYEINNGFVNLKKISSIQ